MTEISEAKKDVVECTSAAGYLRHFFPEVFPNKNEVNSVNGLSNLSSTLDSRRLPELEELDPSNRFWVFSTAYREGEFNLENVYSHLPNNSA